MLRRLVLLATLGGNALGCNLEGAALRPNESVLRSETVRRNDRERVTHHVTVHGIRLTIEIPEGLPRDPTKPGDWNDPRLETRDVPKVFIGTAEAFLVESLDAARHHASIYAEHATWLRSEERVDGWALTSIDRDRTRVEAIVYVRSGSRIVRCKATQIINARDRDEIRSLLESICESMKLMDRGPGWAADAREQSRQRSIVRVPSPFRRSM